MTLGGIVLLISGILLVAFRDRITRQKLAGFDTGSDAFAIYAPDTSASQTLLVVGALVAVLGIGLILVGLTRKPKSDAAP